MSRSSAFLRINEYVSRMEIANLPKSEPVPMTAREAEEYAIARDGRPATMTTGDTVRGRPVVILR